MNSLKLLMSYLQNRYQEVHIGNTSSEKLNIKTGVPQGSVLGPSLFILHINDLPLHIEHSDIDIFADDATLQDSSNLPDSLSQNLQSDVNNVISWCKQNDMLLNERKTKCMLIGTSQKLSKCNSNLEIKVNDHYIENSKCEKLLGVHIDQKLSYENHIDYVCKNVSSKIALLGRIKKFLPLQTRKLYYNAYILSVIDYCLTVWGSASNGQLDILLKLQNHAS